MIVHLLGEGTGSAGQIVTSIVCGLKPYYLYKAIWWEDGWISVPEDEKCKNCVRATGGS